MTAEVSWEGCLLSVQPRIRLTRSFDERAHSYLGYTLRLDGRVADESREFLVGIGKAAHAKLAFRAGDVVRGVSMPVPDPHIEPVEFYKTRGLKVLERAPEADDGPPWTGIPPALEVYRARGHRRLAAKTFDASCRTCRWGCRMPVVIIVDHWNPEQKRYRVETFCYGPKSCALHRPGPQRTVPGRNRMTYTEEDWVDEEATAHRGEDE